MAEYIDRETLKKQLQQSFCKDCENPNRENPNRENCTLCWVEEVLEVIQTIPAADVRPVVHGKWIKPTRVPDSMLDECSVCGFDTGAYTFNFCPNCGADMREES